MILYLLLFLLIWLSPVASDWPWSYAVQGVTHYSWILFHLLLCNIIKFKPRISKFGITVSLLFHGWLYVKSQRDYLVFSLENPDTSISNYFAKLYWKMSLYCRLTTVKHLILSEMSTSRVYQSSRDNNGHILSKSLYGRKQRVEQKRHHNSCRINIV